MSYLNNVLSLSTLSPCVSGKCAVNYFPVLLLICFHFQSFFSLLHTYTEVRVNIIKLKIVM
jgi:hypothetical protein